MDASVRKWIDYVNGYFEPQSRVDRRELQLRWLEHYLKGIDNGVDVQAPLDFFVIGDNTWRTLPHTLNVCRPLPGLTQLALRILTRLPQLA